MATPFFVINLARSPERWEAQRKQAENLGIEMHRVPGVPGAAIDPRDWIDVDAEAFARQHGRTILPGEYGCYRSHLAALKAVLDSGTPYGVVMEDDIVLDERTAARVQAIIDAMPDFDVVKLANHRMRLFRRKTSTSLGDEIGRAMHGPLGSTAAYLVSREGARRLCRALARMELPWDVAIERYWATGVAFYTVRNNIVSWNAYDTTISPEGYARTKLPVWSRIPTALFRAQDYWHRAFNAL